MKKALYGSVELGIATVEIFVRLHLLLFYSQKVGVASFWVSIAIGIFLLWEIAMDPLLGRFSDSWKRQYGTRWHLVLVGAMATALLLVALYHPPTFLTTHQTKWLYLLVVGVLFTTAFSLFSVPYSAMVGDFAADRAERGRWIAWRMIFINAGSFLGILIPGFYLFQERPDSYQQISWVLAMIVLLSAFLGSLIAKPAAGGTSFRPSPLGEVETGALVAFRNKPFLILSLAFFFFNIGLAVQSATALFYYRLHLQLTEPVIRNTLLLFLLVFTLSIPLWTFLGRKKGRKTVLIAGSFAFGLSSCLISFLLPSSQALPVYLWICGWGGILVGVSVLAEMSLTDVIDYGSSQTGRDNFGLYFGLWKLTAKISRTLTLVGLGFLLDWANVNFPDLQTSYRLTTIFGLGVGAPFLLAAASLLLFDLSESRSEEISHQLQLQQKELSNASR